MKKSNKNVLKLRSGRELNVDFVSIIEDPPRCYIRTTDLPLPEAAAIFSDSELIDPMEYNGTKISGFRYLHYLKPEGEALQTCLRR